jgi:hypothetical protein
MARYRKPVPPHFECPRCGEHVKVKDYDPATGATDNAKFYCNCIETPYQPALIAVGLHPSNVVEPMIENLGGLNWESVRENADFVWGRLVAAQLGELDQNA